MTATATAINRPPPAARRHRTRLTIVPSRSAGSAYTVRIQTRSDTSITTGQDGEIRIDVYQIASPETAEPDRDAEAVADFLDNATFHSEEGLIDKGIDEVISFFEAALSDGNLRMCKLALRANVDVLDDAIALSFLSMTFSERAKLEPSRRLFYARLHRRLVAKHGQAEASRLLQGLQ